MRRRGFVSTVVAAVLVIVVVAAVEVGFWTVRANQPVLLDLHAAQNYSGWLVLSWNCDGGDRLEDSKVDGRRYSLDFSEAGTICLADPVPESGYSVLTYRHNGLDDGDSKDGVHLVASPFLHAGPQTVRRDGTATTSIDPAIGATTDHRYDVAWVQVQSVPDGQSAEDTFPDDIQLGDQCDLDRFLQQQFGEPAANVPCGPIPTRLQAGLTG